MDEVTAPASRFVGYNDASQRLGVTVKWLRNAVSEGRVCHYKMNRLVRFDIDDLDHFAEEHRVEARKDRPWVR